MKTFKQIRKGKIEGTKGTWKSMGDGRITVTGVKAKLYKEETELNPGHVMNFSTCTEHRYHGGPEAKQARDAYAKHLKAQGHQVKKTVLRNQILHGRYGHVYSVSYTPHPLHEEDISKFIDKKVKEKKDAKEYAKHHVRDLLTKFREKGTMKEGRLYMPLKGHDYHYKSDDELHYIVKDAAEARDAVGSHDQKAANKYADQVNDAATILHYRKQGGKQLKKVHESVGTVPGGIQMDESGNKKQPPNKPKKLDIKGPGAEEKFQKDPVVTPLTTTYTRGM